VINIDDQYLSYLICHQQHGSLTGTILLLPALLSLFLCLILDMSELAPLDPELLSDVLSKHPFVTVDGVCNIRDLGMIPAEDGENVTRSGFMFRSGELSGVTQLGVRLFFLPL
jgi:hypothetical protein